MSRHKTVDTISMSTHRIVSTIIFDNNYTVESITGIQILRFNKNDLLFLLLNNKQIEIINDGVSFLGIDLCYNQFHESYKIVYVKMISYINNNLVNIHINVSLLVNKEIFEYKTIISFYLDEVLNILSFKTTTNFDKKNTIEIVTNLKDLNKSLSVMNINNKNYLVSNEEYIIECDYDKNSINIYSSYD